MQTIVFNGKSSETFGMLIGGVNNFGAPERIVEEYEIPGRSGTAIFDTGAFRNVLREYVAAIMHRRNLETVMASVKAWLLPDGDYHRLEDSYAPDVYRLARVTGEIPTTALGSVVRSVTFPITFSCRPEKFLKIGEHEIVTDESGAELFNPTVYPATPLIYVQNTGGVNTSVNFYEVVNGSENLRGFIYIPAEVTRPLLVDCETTEVTYADSLGGNANDAIELLSPIYLRQQTRIRGFENQSIILKIRPRWWRI